MFATPCLRVKICVNRPAVDPHWACLFVSEPLDSIWESHYCTRHPVLAQQLKASSKQPFSQSSSRQQPSSSRQQPSSEPLDRVQQLKASSKQPFFTAFCSPSAGSIGPTAFSAWAAGSFFIVPNTCSTIWSAVMLGVVPTRR